LYRYTEASDAACLAEMGAAADAQLAAFATTAEEDEALLAAAGAGAGAGGGGGGGGGGMTPRMEMCVRYRLLQKQNIVAFKRFLDKVIVGFAA
jgi:hypothetical protein